YSILKDLKKENAFVTPDLFFQKSELQLELIAYEKLRGLPKHGVFGLPEKYFANGSSNLYENIAITGKDETQYKALNSIPKSQEFDIPHGYFEKNKESMLNSLGEKKRAKIVHLSFGQAAMAAAAVLLITLGFWFYPNNKSVVSPDNCGTLACIEKRELLQSKQIENLDDDELFELVNPAKLEQKLNPMNKSSDNPNKKDSNNAHKISDDLLDEL
ncbi:MAG: hypothetical protein WCR21_12840, partial [Bacteroidota bacterium]